MKIYFEDGRLRQVLQLPIKPDCVLDANEGVSHNREVLNLLVDNPRIQILYTNSIMAFDNRYAWNEELQTPEIYIRSGEHMVFTRIDKLTNREIKRAHNLEKMYLNGVFEGENNNGKF